jgi:hypothetical protein
MQLLARCGGLRQSPEHQGLREARSRDFARPLDKACFFATSSAVLLNSLCSVWLKSVIVVMKRGLSGCL